MRLDRFAEERGPLWDELEEVVRRSRGKPERLGPEGILRLGRLYRSAAADLAQARRHFPGDPLVARLESLVTRARPVLYSSEPRRAPVREFATTGYWRRVREKPRFMAVAWALMLIPGILALLWALSDPGSASGLVPEQFRHAGESGGHALESGGDQAAFSSAIFTNNIRVSFLAFAGGVLGGLGTVFIDVYNGVLIGTVAGLASGAGNGSQLLELVAPHGFLELSCIAVAAAAGLQVGWAMINPGARARGAALADEARRGAEVVLGTIPWLVLAGLVEGFVTPRRIGVPAALTVGIGLAAVYWAFVLWRGRAPTGERAPSPAGTPVRMPRQAPSA